MLKLTKKADYGLIALRHLAAAPRSHSQSASAHNTHVHSASASAKDIADTYRIPLPLLSKILQNLARAGLLV
jgi:DNA-binding IscR family transcriptional regulator